MGFRTLEISRPAEVHVRRGQHLVSHRKPGSAGKDHWQKLSYPAMTCILQAAYEKAK